MLIKLVEHIDLNEVYQYVQADEAGGLNLFVGTVRNHTKDRRVIKLEFEAYEPMAISEMRKIADEANRRWPLYKIALVHAIGAKAPGEAVVIIAVAAAHRDASFEACRFLIDELKKTVPIWKKEYFEDNSVWVNAHP